MAKSNKWRDLLLSNQGNGNRGIAPIQSVQNTYTEVVSGNVISPALTGPLNKLWRAKILVNRVESRMEKKDTIDEHYPESKKTTSDNRSVRDSQLKTIKDVPDNLNYKRAKETQSKYKNSIFIINPHTSPVTKLEIQAFANVEMNPESTWATVKSMGRNNPFYLFTGSEDTLTFDISWYALDDNRQDVINKCRLLESWTKADGYSASPPTLWISWGDSDLFSNDYFILKSAPYKPTNFQRSYRKGNRKDDSSEIINLMLYPNTATQTLTFHRVASNNLKHENIIPKTKLNTTTGVTI